jgi:hypothetical protein
MGFGRRGWNRFLIRHAPNCFEGRDWRCSNTTLTELPPSKTHYKVITSRHNMPMTKAQSRSLREHLGNDSFQMILRYSSDARPPWLVFQAADFQVKTHAIASQATGRPRGWFNLRISKSMNWLIFPSSMFLKGTLQLLRKEIVTNPHIVLILIQVTLL